MSRNTPFSRTFEVYLDYPEPFKSLRDELDGSEENLKDIAAGPDDLEKIQRAVRRVNEQIESLIWSCIEEVQTQGNAFAKVIAQTKGNRIFSGWMFDKLSLTRYRRKFISIGFYFGEKPRSLSVLFRIEKPETPTTATELRNYLMAQAPELLRDADQLDPDYTLAEGYIGVLNYEVQKGDSIQIILERFSREFSILINAQTWEEIVEIQRNQEQAQISAA